MKKTGEVNMATLAGNTIFYVVALASSLWALKFLFEGVFGILSIVVSFLGTDGLIAVFLGMAFSVIVIWPRRRPRFFSFSPRNRREWKRLREMIEQAMRNEQSW